MSFYLYFLTVIILRLSTDLCQGQNEDSEEVYDIQEIIEDDMLFYVKADLTRAGAINEKGYRQNLKWPNKTVIYKVDSLLKKQTSHYKKVLQAMADIQKAVPGCVKFRAAKASDSHWTTIQSNGSGCFATVGYVKRIGLNQVTNVNQECDTGAIVHEFLHTLGFLHEHTRNDRDAYVRVNMNNVKAPYKSNYIKDEVEYNTTYYAIRYNYASIMYYPLRVPQWAVNPSKAIMVNLQNSNGTGSTFNITKVGNRRFLSKGDLQMIAKRYGCKVPSISRYNLTGVSDVSDVSDVFQEEELVSEEEE